MHRKDDGDGQGRERVEDLTEPDRVVGILGTMNSGEYEFLFVPFSVFTVRCVTWSPTPTQKSTPHLIEIDAISDNQDAKEDLPLAPWC